MNNTHQLPALSEAQEFEVALRLTARMMADKGRTIAERDETIAERDKAIADHQRASTEQERAVAERDQTIAGQRHTIAEHERTNIEQQRTIAEREQTIADLQHTLAERDNMIADQKRTIAEKQRGLDEHERMFADQQPALIELNYMLSDQARSLGSQAQQAATMAAMVITARTRTARTAAAPNAVAPGGAPTGGAATGDASMPDAATADNDTDDNYTDGDNTGDEMPESLHAAKRRRLNQQALEYMHPFVLIGHDVLAKIFNNATGRQLVPAGGEPQRIAQELAGLEPFMTSIPQRTRAVLSELTGLHLLRRSDVDLETLRTYVLRQLGVAERPGAMVLGPVLCYVLVTLCGIRLEQMSGEIVDKIFRTVTNRSLRSLLVVTESGAKQMAPDKLCYLAKVWVQDLCKFIVEEGGVGRVQEAMTQCNDSYEHRCNESGHSGGDPKGAIAKMILSDDSNDSNIFLGLGDDAYDLEVLCERFFAIADSSVDQRTAARLRQITDS
ncbi:hypothetical protein H4R27_004056 [Coemansia aciculifera]|nr:hypothetical protein H4R27_004056 [Coemansia aciculifera]